MSHRKLWLKCNNAAWIHTVTRGKSPRRYWSNKYILGFTCIKRAWLIRLDWFTGTCLQDEGQDNSLEYYFNLCLIRNKNHLLLFHPVVDNYINIQGVRDLHVMLMGRSWYYMMDLRVSLRWRAREVLPRGRGLDPRECYSGESEGEGTRCFD